MHFGPIGLSTPGRHPEFPEPGAGLRPDHNPGRSITGQCDLHGGG